MMTKIMIMTCAADCDAIVNFAAESHVDRSILEPTAFLHTGVMGVYALLEAALEQSQARDGAFRLVQVSTDEVYYAGICQKCERPYNVENRSLAYAQAFATSAIDVTYRSPSRTARTSMRMVSTFGAATSEPRRTVDGSQRY